MNRLKQRILEDGKCFEGGILKVDSFINHQMDPSLMKSVAVEFVKRFAAEPLTKIVTIESSGIAPAIMMGYLLEIPVVFIKKKKPKTMHEHYVTVVHSFTKDRDYTAVISREFLSADDKVLFIDDFLAFGNAALGAADLIRQAGARLVGMGFIIEKVFQSGGEMLRSQGIRVESLARIRALDDCSIEFE